MTMSHYDPDTDFPYTPVDTEDAQIASVSVPDIAPLECQCNCSYDFI